MAIDFERDNSQFIDFGDTAELTNQGTICCWLNIESLTTVAAQIWFVGKDHNTSGRSFAFGIQSTAAGAIFLNWQVAGSSRSLSVSSFALATWYHVGVTHDNTANVSAYFVNGVSDNSTTDNNNVLNVAANLNIGRRSYSGAEGYFDGIVEDARIYDRILTANEFAILANGYRGPLGSELLWAPLQDASGIGHWDGTVLSSASHVIPDRSNTGSAGTPQQSPVAAASETFRMGAMI